MRYRKISIKKGMADAVEKFVEQNPQFGYRSIAEFVEDAVRRRAEAMGVVGLGGGKPRFTHLNVLEDHATLMDNQLDKIVEVYFQRGRAFCSLCEEHDCEHTQYALSLPEVANTLRDRGWIIEDGKVVKAPG